MSIILPSSKRKIEEKPFFFLVFEAKNIFLPFSKMVNFKFCKKGFRLDKDKLSISVSGAVYHNWLLGENKCKVKLLHCIQFTDYFNKSLWTSLLLSWSIMACTLDQAISLVARRAQVTFMISLWATENDNTKKIFLKMTPLSRCWGNQIII